MTSSRDDVIGLCDHAWKRFRRRMRGLADPEWTWQPGADDRVALRWRLQHIADLLREERNAPWLGLAEEPGASPGRRPSDGPSDGPSGSPPERSRPNPARHRDAAGALDDVGAAYASWRSLLDRTTEDSLAASIGPPAGRYGEATRRSFALHVIDELIHHSAEAALLRDLYAMARPDASDVN